MSETQHQLEEIKDLALYLENLRSISFEYNIDYILAKGQLDHIFMMVSDF